VKQKLLSPTQLKEFRRQQENQRRIRLQEIKNKEKELKRIISPKKLFGEDVVVEESIREHTKVNPIAETNEKTPYELLEDKVDILTSTIQNLKETQKYEEELAKLEILVSTKIGFDEINIEEIFSKIDSVRKSIPSIPEFPVIKEYDDEIISIKDNLKTLSDSIENTELIESLTERVDKLQVSGSEIFTQHGENIKEIRKVLFSLLDDFNQLNIPEKFNSEFLEDQIKKIHETLTSEIVNLKEEILNLPKVKYYDIELEDLQNRIINIRESIPEIPEIKTYDKELELLRENILEVQKNIPELPEVKYYENEIGQLEKQIKLVESKIPEIPDLPEIKYYDYDIKKLNHTIKNITESLIYIKKQVFNINSSVDNIPESIDWSHEIEYLYDQIEKLKKRPLTIKEVEIIKETDPNTVSEDFHTPSPDVSKETDALAPLTQNFVTFEDLASHYRTFIMRVQQQLSSLGGGGEVNLRFLDDIDRSSISDGRVLSYDAASKKFRFIDPGTASTGIATEALKIKEVDKTFEYIAGTLSTVTTLYGTKTFLYEEDVTTIIGTGIYESKRLVYDGESNLIAVEIL
jgi:hypothetical protein